MIHLSHIPEFVPELEVGFPQLLKAGGLGESLGFLSQTGVQSVEPLLPGIFLECLLPGVDGTVGVIVSVGAQAAVVYAELDKLVLQLGLPPGQVVVQQQLLEAVEGEVPCKAALYLGEDGTCSVGRKGLSRAEYGGNGVELEFPLQVGCHSLHVRHADIDVLVAALA